MFKIVGSPKARAVGIQVYGKQQADAGNRIGFNDVPSTVQADDLAGIGHQFTAIRKDPVGVGIRTSQTNGVKIRELSVGGKVIWKIVSPSEV